MLDNAANDLWISRRLNDWEAKEQIGTYPPQGSDTDDCYIMKRRIKMSVSCWDTAITLVLDMIDQTIVTSKRESITE